MGVLPVYTALAIAFMADSSSVFSFFFFLFLWTIAVLSPAFAIAYPGRFASSMHSFICHSHPRFSTSSGALSKV
jgi:hypothetical protein